MRIFHNQLKSKNVTATNIAVTADMLKSVRASQARYEESQLEYAKQNKSSDKDLKCKIITNVSEEIKRKKVHLQESVNFW